MSRRACIRTWFDIVISTLSMGLSALVGMLALEYLVTGTFGAVREYAGIAVVITLVLLGWKWRRHHRTPADNYQSERTYGDHPQSES